MLNILIKGCGVAGLTLGWELKKHQCKISFCAPENAPIGSASWFAGGMLAPFCENISAPKLVQTEGIKALAWWRSNFVQHVQNTGTLVLATTRDQAELVHFARDTEGHQKLATHEIAELEPHLGKRFQQGLFYKDEAYLDPRRILGYIKKSLQEQSIGFFTSVNENEYDIIIDCTGINYAKQNKELRGVRGEMLLIKCSQISLHRNIRLLHPRIPLYIVPRENNIFMIGATMIESESEEPILIRSMMELLNSCYALHPIFANGQILEASVGIRPAFSDNLPKIIRESKYIFINGFYRHGFLLAPYIVQNVVNLLKEEAKI